jgi:SAM-dependent methyltransferase
VNFDRVADIYDATRGMPEAALEHIVDCIVEATGATAETHFLEIGIGTGRIALPIAKRGYRCTGVDISERMMSVLGAKAEAGGIQMELVSADITRLPLPDDSFDVVIAVHVLHLIPEWTVALAEAGRVLKPHGHFVHGGESHGEGWPGRIRRQWAEFVKEEGVSPRPRYGDRLRVEEALTDQGCYLATYRAARWEEELVPLELLEQMRTRTFSQSWEVPDDVLARVHERMLAWAEKELGDLHNKQAVTEEFSVMATRLEAAAEARIH